MDRKKSVRITAYVQELDHILRLPPTVLKSYKTDARNANSHVETSPISSTSVAEGDTITC